MASVWSANGWLLDLDRDSGTFKYKDLLRAGPKDTNLGYFWVIKMDSSSHPFLSLPKWDHLYKPTVRVLDTWQAYIKCYCSFLFFFFFTLLMVILWNKYCISRYEHLINNNNILGAHCSHPWAVPSAARPRSQGQGAGQSRRVTSARQRLRQLWVSWLQETQEQCAEWNGCLLILLPAPPPSNSLPAEGVLGLIFWDPCPSTRPPSGPDSAS